MEIRQEYTEYCKMTKAMGDIPLAFRKWFVEKARTEVDTTDISPQETGQEQVATDHVSEQIWPGDNMQLQQRQLEEQSNQISTLRSSVGHAGRRIKELEEFITKMSQPSVHTHNHYYSCCNEREHSTLRDTLRGYLIQIARSNFEHEAGYLVNFFPFAEICRIFGVVLPAHQEQVGKPKFNQSGTATGRVSCKEPNVVVAQSDNYSKPTVPVIGVNKEPPTDSEIMEYLAPMVGQKVMAERAHRVPGTVSGAIGVLGDDLMLFGDGTKHPYILREGKPPLGVKWDTINLYTEATNIDTTDGMTDHITHGHVDEIAPMITSDERQQAVEHYGLPFKIGDCVVVGAKRIKGYIKDVALVMDDPPNNGWLYQLVDSNHWWHMGDIKQYPSVTTDENSAQHELNKLDPITEPHVHKRLVGEIVTAERKFHTGGNDGDLEITGEYIGAYYPPGSKVKQHGIKRKISGKTKVTAIKLDTMRRATEDERFK